MFIPRQESTIDFGGKCIINGTLERLEQRGLDGTSLDLSPLLIAIPNCATKVLLGFEAALHKMITAENGGLSYIYSNSPFDSCSQHLLNPLSI